MQSIISELYQINAIQTGEFVLKSGQTSTIYCNLRKIISYPPLLQNIADAMWEKIKATKFDLICGVPYTALPIATAISLKHNLPMVMRRKEKKDYGTKQLIEGVYESGMRCLLIEDTVTTGMSILETAADLEAEGLIITDVVAVIDREQGGREALAKKYRFHALHTLTEIINYA